ncbi:serine/threonine-protein kinase fused-like isoform X2 [Sitophilus oryzae]|uniref:non-specific serine/threonine protein kinase n=1 Tax=Sitophilus oryzae TaxID=7048 RepID=A0A6J2YFG1_SITOR|nr:serine/threonine-protein kinase fused-like isoform X2 [Sitophilus oryzae]
MDKYEVVGTLGEGSFGRVYKAKQVSNGSFVALKVISKRGRSTKELKGFRRECEIQRDLHHPNIIQMLDSFETENEIVVITEFAPRELTAILSKEGYLSEEKVQQIVWDLISALYYLHSNRVLHRDLKPQNILLDLKSRAKLCDFGFARNMSTGTHVLTSIKGTPLYMAPELIDELPYDYNADLWSLGCITYELLMGTPPFCTSSILHLIRMIKHEQIQWPTFLSPECTSFLKGLLQKNPAKRLAWEQILNHPFVKGHILITKTTGPMPLTAALTASTQEVKEQQRKDSINNKHLKGAVSRTISTDNDHTKQNIKSGKTSNETKKSSGNQNNSKCSNPQESRETHQSLEDKRKSKIISSKEEENLSLKERLNFIEDSHPIEPDEWVVFLQRSIQEVMNGEITSLTQPNLTNIIVSPLKNSNSNSKVLCFVAKLLSIAFVIKDISTEQIEQIKKVYLEVKLVPNLIYATKLLLRITKSGHSTSSSNSHSNSSQDNSVKLHSYKTADVLEVEDLQALESIFTLVCYLVHMQDEFLIQFCDAVLILNVFGLINLFLCLVRRKPRITIDVLSILTQTIRRLPENTEIVEKILLNSLSSNNEIDFGDLLRNSNPILRERSCYFILLMGKYFQASTLEKFWSIEIQDTLEALMFDSMQNVRNAAEAAVNELKHKDFYIKSSTSF